MTFQQVLGDLDFFPSQSVDWCFFLSYFDFSAYPRQFPPWCLACHLSIVTEPTSWVLGFDGW
jgi:hypothetical protein